MSTIINDGGPAFALPGLPFCLDGVPQNPFAGYGWAVDPQPGMTLRDWFAGQALAGKCGYSAEDAILAKKLASESYLIADAMIAAREAKQ